MVNEKDDIPNIYQRVVDTLSGKKPDRIPFIDRLELWYTSHCRAETLPDEFKKPQMDLTEIHRAVGIGQEHGSLRLKLPGPMNSGKQCGNKSGRGRI